MNTDHTYRPGKTIAAITTAPGNGGVAIIRISGKEAVLVANRAFSGPVKEYPSHMAHFGYVVDEKGEKVDSALLLVMRAPRSYTGEDTVEIQCHGGQLIARRVLDTVLKAGALAALPGEFTFQAFLNDKLDLVQAEAVQELIAAKSERALDAATQQLQGALSRKVSTFQKKLTKQAAILEAWVDFPEEGLEFTTPEAFTQELKETREEMQRLHDTFHDGTMIKQGFSLCLVGAPNVGKSSLLNALVDKERAIVSDTPGTTRDIVEEEISLNGVPLRLIDTAGIRDTQEEIEQEGIKRTKRAMKEADLVLWVIDGQKGPCEELQKLLPEMPSSSILAWNKVDLPHKKPESFKEIPLIPLSAKTGEGLDALKKQIDALIWSDAVPEKEEVLLTNVRHKEALSHSLRATQRVLKGLENNLSPEFLTLDMRHSLHALGSIIGTNVGEDILSSIFSQFCIGK